MSYKGLVKQNVSKAFGYLKDLAITLTLSQTNKTSFDFANNVPEVTTPVTKVIKGIELKAKRAEDASKQTILKRVMLIADEIPDPDIYDSVTLNDNTVWRFVPPYENNGYTITVTLSKEA